MSKITYLKYLKFGYNKAFLALIVVVCFVFVFVSATPIMAEGIKLQFINLFHHGIIYYKFFSIFELLVIFLLIFLNRKFIIRFSFAPVSLRLLYFFALLGWFFRMINPNNSTINPILGMPLFSNVEEYLFLFFLYTILFIKKENLLFFIYILFKYIFIFSLIKAFFVLLIGFVQGSNIIVGGIVRVLYEIDTLFLFSFLQPLSLGLYLLSKKKIYLIGFALFLLVTFLSNYRTAFYIGLLSNLLTFIFFISNQYKQRVIRLISGFVLIFMLGLLVLSFGNSNDVMNASFERVLSAIPGYQSSRMGSEYSDTGHWEQSKNTTKTMLEKHLFWGTGLGKTNESYLEGQSMNIHNAYAGIWFHQGLISLLFYLFVIFLVLKQFLKVTINLNKYNFNFNIIPLMGIIYLMVFSFSTYYTPKGMWTDFRMQFFWGLIFAFSIRIDATTFKYFISNKIINL